MTAVDLFVLVLYGVGCWRFLGVLSYGLFCLWDRLVWALHDHDVKDHRGCCPGKVPAHV